MTRQEAIESIKNDAKQMPGKRLIYRDSGVACTTCGKGTSAFAEEDARVGRFECSDGHVDPFDL